MQKLTKTEPIENEIDILLDHDYDGIKELDNNLPPWWVYLFYASIVLDWYFVRYEVMATTKKWSYKRSSSQNRCSTE
jgi:cytochrome c oxidase cbb3-type subunit 3